MLLLAAALGVALTAAGCGGDDDGEETTRAPLTREEFISEADAICAEGDREIEEAGEELGDAPSEEELEQFTTEVVVPNVQDQIDQLRELPPPEGDEEDVAAILDAAQRGVDELEADPSLGIQGEDAGGAFAEANQRAQGYGLTDCGGG